MEIFSKYFNTNVTIKNHAFSLFQVDEQGDDHSQNVILPHDDNVDTEEAKPTTPPNMPSQVICSAILVNETCLC